MWDFRKFTPSFIPKRLKHFFVEIPVGLWVVSLDRFCWPQQITQVLHLSLALVSLVRSGHDDLIPWPPECWRKLLHFSEFCGTRRGSLIIKGVTVYSLYQPVQLSNQPEINHFQTLARPRLLQHLPKRLNDLWQQFNDRDASQCFGESKVSNWKFVYYYIDLLKSNMAMENHHV